MEIQGIDATINPAGSLDILSQQEMHRLHDTSQGGLYELFRRCALAVLNCDSRIDDTQVILEQFKHFDIQVMQEERGIKLHVKNAPPSAFVDGNMIRGIREHLFSVLRDVVYVSHKIMESGHFDLEDSSGITNAVFHILRNARALPVRHDPNLVVCWGGHSINRLEYEYTKKVGYQLGLRGFNICTGCGPGAMKGPMKGATIAHAKQRLYKRNYIGLSEPGIIAAESPNPIVNDLVILPDIEKRLEAFVRLGHAILVFPGGAGTAEEILYILGILLHPDNKDQPFPLIFTGPKESADYFQKIHEFIGTTLGAEAQDKYHIIIDDPEQVARDVHHGLSEVKNFRKRLDDAYYYNWLLKIEPDFQHPFAPTHENVANLDLHQEQERHSLAAHLRRAFSAIVAGNVKEDGLRAIEEHGPYEIRGSRDIMDPLNDLLKSFVEQRRMKLSTEDYTPCYTIVS